MRSTAYKELDVKDLRAPDLSIRGYSWRTQGRNSTLLQPHGEGRLHISLGSVVEVRVAAYTLLLLSSFFELRRVLLESLNSKHTPDFIIARILLLDKLVPSVFDLLLRSSGGRLAGRSWVERTVFPLW